MVWRVEKADVRAEQVDSLTKEVQEGRRVVVTGPGGRGKTDVLLDVTRRLGEQALLVRVPSGLDQVEAVVIQAAAGLGDKALREVDAALRDDVDRLEPALNVLRQHSRGRLLVVDDIDCLAPNPGDMDLDGVIGERREALDAWLGEHASLCSSEVSFDRLGLRTWALSPPEVPPLRLVNDVEHDVMPVWKSVGGDLGRFRLAMALAQIEQSPPDARVGREDRLLEAIWAALPGSQREVLGLLAIHGRPLADEVWQALPSPLSPSVISQVRSMTAIVGSDGRSLWLEGPARRFAEARLSPEERVHAHLCLAAAFAGELRGDEPNVWSKAASLVEAERHYAAAGQPDRALLFARYGVALLLDLARKRSLLGRFQQSEYDAAAAIYESILNLPEHRIGPRAWAYAKHYLHYNRYKAKPALVEPVSKTEAGYRASVERWPENALFWSRLALTQFLQGERGRALSTLKEARAKVPAHRRKEWYLRCRTVQHLLRFEPPHVVDALHVWEHYEARDHSEAEAKEELYAALSRGFSAALLEAPDVPTVHLHREIKVTIPRTGKGFSCTLEELYVSARADTPLAALAAAIRKLRDETDRFRRALTHTLDPAARAQKQRLLGSVDIVASRLLGEIPESTWILGKVIADQDGSMVVREVGASARTFTLGLADALEPSLLPDTHPRLVCVRTGAAGEPVGPVVELGEPLGRNPERLWAEWRKRLGEAEPSHE
ncbi:tetratricopeptide repeat protein [Sorangium sp. So ce1151]|uniref:tetratricopeptide repeat protein n=1 Tax=Sorangium sp. So ce1151 TaxID=3133332 RepID=UPI003F5E443B